GRRTSNTGRIAMRQSHDVTVEVAGRPVVSGLTLTLRAGHKVGLVGRNGAGKTSLLKVLAGEAQPFAGTVLRKGRLGYLRQDPRIRKGDTSLPSLTYVLDARGLGEATTRLEKLRLALEEDHSARNVARFARAEEQCRVAGGYSAEAEVRRIGAGLGLAPDRIDLRGGALSGGER